MMMVDAPNPTPRIYVASLADYNAGRLYGRWIEASYGADEIREEIEDMLANSPEPIAEDWAIHDYEGFEGLQIDEYDSLDAIAEAAELIDSHGPKAAQVIAYYGGLDDLDEARDALLERYAGSATSLEDWAAEELDEIGLLEQVPEQLRSYIDFKSYGRDMELGGEIITFRVDGELHVFRTQ
jgi:antirestriction protein